ncbi:MAG: hypothetical protein R2867_05895 [Caldilineaceae bacterium]
MEFVHPDQWLRLQQLIAEANANPAVYLSLGNQYRTILDDIPTTNEYQDARNRFYAQALAAYSAGIEQLTNGAASSELGSLYSALLPRSIVPKLHWRMAGPTPIMLR